MKFLEVFPTTIATFNIKSFDKKFLRLAKKSFPRDGVVGRQKASGETNVLNLPEFNSVKKEILTSSVKYSKKIWGLQLEKPTVSCSWFTRLKKNDAIQPHRHMHAHLTGLLYLTSGSETCFQSPNEPPGIMPDIVNYKNCYQFFIKPKKGLCVLFPSSLYHSVVQSCDKTRYSIAFNVNPTGNIGTSLSKINIS
jgi:hypothetical protein